MTDFWQDFTEIEHEHALQTQGGMKIGFSRQELEDYFNVLLEKRSLEQMIGETAYWVLIPSIIAVYSFPVLLFVSNSLLWAVLGSFGFMMSFSVLNQSMYNYVFNRYIVRPVSHAIPKVVVMILAGVYFYLNDMGIITALFPLFWYFIIDRIPILYLICELILIKTKSWLYKLPDPDGVLRQVGWHWARKYKLAQNDSGRIIGKPGA